LGLSQKELVMFVETQTLAVNYLKGIKRRSAMPVFGRENSNIEFGFPPKTGKIEPLN
jgi:hypothetical protein